MASRVRYRISRGGALLGDFDVSFEALPLGQGDLARDAVDGADHFLCLIGTEVRGTEREAREGRLAGLGFGGTECYKDVQVAQVRRGVVHDQIVNFGSLAGQADHSESGDFDLL